MTEEKIEIHERLTRLETLVDGIKNNDLAHLWDKVCRVDNRTWWILGTLVVGFLASIALSLLKK